MQLVLILALLFSLLGAPASHIFSPIEEIDYSVASGKYLATQKHYHLFGYSGFGKIRFVARDDAFEVKRRRTKLTRDASR